MAAQESPSFILHRLSIAAASQTIGSAHFETTLTVSQESPVGAASICNTSLTNSLGFWSVLGDLPVPVILTLRRNAVDPQAIDLTWTGNAPTFQVYRDYTPQNVVSLANLERTTALCSATDSLAFQSNVIYYEIEALPPAP
ncbi:MAG TPA: hypothetical protein VJV75_13150 [Candidatus Polarisedimenticolia bacterium]|nr:hypothetical protein [Candidatus Polarisedimenticolia bacterium]